MDNDLKILLGQVSVETKKISQDLSNKSHVGADLDELHDLSSQLHDQAFKISEIASTVLERM